MKSRDKEKREELKRAVKRADKNRNLQNEYLEPLFDDFYARRGRVYRLNFFRGIWLGLGIFIGGTVVIAIVVFLLNFLIDIPGGIGDFISWVVDTIESGR